MPVLFFHLGISGFPGGFVGVDVFFVISGFLITSLILPDILADRFSLLAFYERRCRRLFPALATVLVTSAVLAVLLLLPDDLKKFGDSLIGAALSVSNFVFASQVGYFDAAAITKPLLNTWSLAVEEQFYLIYPLLLLVIVRYARPWLKPALLALALVSLACSIEAVLHERGAAYFHLHVRGFELLIGAMLAAGMVRPLTGRVSQLSASLAGLALIAFATFSFSEATPFPGVAALIPCLGTALLLHAGAGGGTAVQRLLSTPPLVAIGRISYPIYLWHWPLIVFFAYIAMRMPNALEQAGLIAATFLLSFLTYRYVETPFRVRRLAPTLPRMARWVVAGSAMVIVVGATFSLLKGVPQRLSSEVAQAMSYEKSGSLIRTLCEPAAVPVELVNMDRTYVCTLGDASAEFYDFALIGDSHGEATAYQIGERARRFGLKGIAFIQSGCTPALGVRSTRRREKDCVEMVKAAIDRINELNVPEVLVVARWRVAMNAPQYRLENLRQRVVWDGQEPSDNDSVIARGLDRTLDGLGERSVTLLGGIPEIGIPVPRIVAQSVKYGHVPPQGPTLSEYWERQAPVVAMLNRAAERPNVKLLWPSTILCPNEVCQIRDGDTLFYYDDDHPSEQGAARISAIFDDTFQRLADINRASGLKSATFSLPNGD